MNDMTDDRLLADIIRSLVGGEFSLVTDSSQPGVKVTFRETVWLTDDQAGALQRAFAEMSDARMEAIRESAPPR